MVVKILTLYVIKPHKSKQKMFNVYICRYLTQYDCVTFYNLVNSLKTTEEALKSSGWMLLSSAETLFLNSKLRVFGAVNNPPKKSKKENNDGSSTMKELNGKK